MRAVVVAGLGAFKENVPVFGALLTIVLKPTVTSVSKSMRTLPNGKLGGSTTCHVTVCVLPIGQSSPPLGLSTVTVTPDGSGVLFKKTEMSPFATARSGSPSALKWPDAIAKLPRLLLLAVPLVPVDLSCSPGDMKPPSPVPGKTERLCLGKKANARS